MLKLCIGLVVLSAVLANGQVQQNVPNSKPHAELPCLSTGGTCVMAEDCPKGELSRPLGLCPLQQPQGVECCYHLYRKFGSKCSIGGACMSRGTICPEIEEASGECEADEKCCILF